MIRQMIKKDLLVELRSKRTLAVYLPISILIAASAAAAISTAMLPEALITSIFPGILWLCFVFAGSVSLGKIFEADSENSAMDALILLGVPPWKMFLAKTISTLLVVYPVHLLSSIALSILLNISLYEGAAPYMLVSLLASLAYSALASLLGAMAQSSSLKNMLLPIIMLPLIFPILFCGINLTSDIIGAASLNYESIWLSLLVGLDVLYIVLGINLFEFVVGE